MNKVCHVLEFSQDAKAYVLDMVEEEVLSEDVPYFTISTFANGHKTLNYWVCDGDIPDNFSRWIYLAVTPKNFIWFVNGEIPLKALIGYLKEVLVVDKFTNVAGIRAAWVKTSTLPDIYFPPDDSFFVYSCDDCMI